MSGTGSYESQTRLTGIVNHILFESVVTECTGATFQAGDEAIPVLRSISMSCLIRRTGIPPAPC